MSKACRFTASPVVSWNNKSLLRRERETWKLLMLLWRTQRQGTRLATQTHRPNLTCLKRIAQHRLNKMVYFYSWYLSTLTACQLLFITVSSRYTVPRTMQLEGSLMFFQGNGMKLVFSQTQSFTSKMLGAERVACKTRQKSFQLQSPFHFWCFLHGDYIMFQHITHNMNFLWVIFSIYTKPFYIELFVIQCIQLISRTPAWTIR